MADNVRRLPTKTDPTGEEIALGLAKFWWWVVSRSIFGPFLIMHTTGMLHLYVSRTVPNLDISQSIAMTFALLVLGFFLRR